MRVIQHSLCKMILILVCCSNHLIADHSITGWTIQDSIWESGFGGLMIVDVGQSDHFSSKTGAYETNPFLPRYPSRHQMELFGVGVIAVHCGISIALPKKYRRNWQMITIGMEGLGVARNFHLGWDIRF